MACGLLPAVPTDTVYPTLTPTSPSSPAPAPTDFLPTSTPQCTPASSAACICPDFWPHYVPSSLKTIIELAEESMVGTPDYLMSGDFYQSRVLVKFTGRSRPIVADRSERIGIWLKTFGLDQPTAELFNSEILFLEDSTEYWLPIQSQLVPHLYGDIAEDEKVLILVVFAGAKLQENGSYDWLILVNEYCTVPRD
jgi:hypothetical protein